MAADDDVEAVIEFLRKNGLKEAESALQEDMIEKCDLGSFDFEKFLFPVLPPVKIPATLRRPDIEEVNGAERSGGSASGSFSSSSSSDEFVSLGSSTSGVCSSSDFTNPYGLRSVSLGSSEASSDSLSQFGTARDYHDYDMQNDLYWHDERDEGNFLTPCFGASDFFGCPSEDKFIMTLEADKQFEDPLAEYDKSEGLQSEESIDFLDKPCLFNIAPRNGETEVQVTQYYQFDNNDLPEAGIGGKVKDCAAYGCSLPFCKCCAGAKGVCDGDFVDYSSSKKTELNDSSADCDSALHLRTNKNSNYSNKRGSRKNWIDGLKDTSNLHVKVSEKNFMPNGNDLRDGEFNGGGLHEPKAGAEEEDVNANDLLVFDNHEDEFEIFNLRIIHRKNRTGFEENKDLPIVLNTVIAGRYHVTEYLGSAAFSKVFQANDLHTGIDVCLKIIKNDKDFFDQSLDEIKLLKFVNRHDPADERHILRLYDYFYHQEHLFIVCELLKANLYEFQKFNQDSGGEPYFTLSRLQAITLQCLEGLEYLHQLGVIHCDLKPENILMKSYRRCEVKIIDLGSSCFENDNLCLYVQSRSYRAPEVILGLPYNQKIDLWSLGCILAELCSGEVLFPNDAVVMILARMVGMVGPIDLEMLVNGQETYKYFTKEYDLYHVNEDTDQLEYIIPESSSLEHHLQVSDVGFIDFVRNLLEINPQKRLSAREALKHPWLSHSY